MKIGLKSGFEEWYKTNALRLADIPNLDPVTKDVKQRVVAERAWAAAILEVNRLIKDGA